jgi:hypothetical protein
MSVVVIYNKSSNFGLSKDAGLLATTSRAVASGLGVTVGSIKTMDPMEPPVACDVAVHLEIPVMNWVPWARYNILMVNPEWFIKEAWTPYLANGQAFDLLVVRCEAAAEQLRALAPSVAERVWVQPWCASWTVAEALKEPASITHKDGFVAILGKSASKHVAIEQIIPLWRAGWPKLQVYSADEKLAAWLLNVPHSDNIEIKVGELSEMQWARAACWAPGALLCSAAEGFGYAAAEAEVAGSFGILNNLDVYLEDYKGHDGVVWIGSQELPEEEKAGKFLRERMVFRDAGNASGEQTLTNSQTIRDAGIQDTLDAAIAAFETADLKTVREQRQKSASERQATFRVRLREMWARVGVEMNAKIAASGVKNLNRHLPPIVDGSNCPKISIVTLTYNRRKFFHLAAHNMLLTDYPKDKIEWVIVDDSDDPADSPSDLIISFKNTNTAIDINYVPLPPLKEGKRSIGAKRNIGVGKATADIIVFMDDDDHYPITSIRRRVAWLVSMPEKQIVGCTTIAMYDLLKGSSAVNCPPMDIPLGQRVSEATFCFRKKFWEERRFEDVSIAEGENWLTGRESAWLEVSPQQIIVAFTHGKNTSSRQVPVDGNSSSKGRDISSASGGNSSSKGRDISSTSSASGGNGCFWGFPREFLAFIHGLAGIQVEWADGATKATKKK